MPLHRGSAKALTPPRLPSRIIADATSAVRKAAKPDGRRVGAARRQAEPANRRQARWPTHRVSMIMTYPWVSSVRQEGREKRERGRMHPVALPYPFRGLTY